MIPIILWNEDSDGNVTNEVLIKCDDVDITEPRQSYRSSRTEKGRKRQDWYSTYTKIVASYKDLPEEDFNTLNNLIKKQTGDTVIIYNNTTYTVVFESEEFSYKHYYSEALGKNMYNGTLTMEEIFTDKDGV